MISFDRVSKVYPDGTVGLQETTLTIQEGEFAVLIGKSGAGKSTLLRLINGLNTLTTGEVHVDGKSVSRARGRELRMIRSRIGMIFQNFNLVGVSTVQRNVISGRLAHNPAWRGMTGLFPKSDYAMVHDALSRVGLTEKLHSRTDQLSGGQAQRVAIARAIVQQPRVLLADEPVASLDPVSTDTIMNDLQRIGAQLGLTVVMSLHSVPLARAYASRIIGLRGGAVVFDGTAAEASDEKLREIYGEEFAALREPTSP